jgi:DNA polymerase III subunit alpha
MRLLNAIWRIRLFADLRCPARVCAGTGLRQQDGGVGRVLCPRFAGGAGSAVRRAAYQARLQTEIEVIRNFDFPGIFLIVWDAIRWAKMHDIRVGPGRGTSASSLVAYSLQITDIDPIEHSLLFERFLNPKHITRPDFDVDICRQRRGEVVAYLQHKYGHDNVGQIIAFDRLKGRGCIRAAGRALNYSSSEIARIASLVPDASYVTLQHALAQEPKLHDLCAKDLWAHQLFEIALRLENLNSEVGTHPVGVVISGEPLWKVVPVCRVPNGQEGEIVTQYDMNDVERVGLVKFDFLDSQCLTVIGETVKFINLRRAKASHVPPALHSVLATKATEAIETFDLRQISMCDPAVFRELSMGNTTGVFQFEWSGCRTFFKQLKPDCFEDIVAAGALYRPGPLYSGMVDDIVDRKHGRTNIEIPHPWLKEVLKPTYGIIVYQEQLTRAIQVMAGYSLGDAELLRRAMATKKPLLMAQHRRTFVDGAVKLNVPSEQAEVIFDVMVHYAGYAFNKSHAAAYALMTVQTAWLKSHYPGEFMAALMKSEHDNSNMMICLINEAKRMAVDVLPPSVNESEVDINVIDGKIRFGLGDIKGVGAEVVEAIFSARQTGPFKSLRDFCRRVGMKQLNSRTLEALVKTGAFDSIAAGLDGSTNIADIGRARSAMFAAIELVMDEFAQRQHHTGVGLSSLFAMLEAPSPEDLRGDPQPAFSAWREREVLDFEKQHLGLYVTGHPLDHYAADVARHGAASIFDISSPDYEPDDEHQVLLAGVVTRLQQWPSTPGGGSTAIVRFEDKTGAVDVLVSSIQFGMFEDILKCGSRVFIRGELLGKFGADGFCQKIRAKQVTLLSDVFPHVNE